MLYYSFIEQDDLLLVDRQLYKLYTKAFWAYKETYTYSLDYYTNPEDKDPISDSKSNKELDLGLDKE